MTDACIDQKTNEILRAIFGFSAFFDHAPQAPKRRLPEFGKRIAAHRWHCHHKIRARELAAVEKLESDTTELYAGESPPFLP